MIRHSLQPQISIQTILHLLNPTGPETRLLHNNSWNETSKSLIMYYFIPLYTIGWWLVGFKAHLGPVNCNVTLNYISNDTHFALKSDLDSTQVAEGWEIWNEITHVSKLHQVKYFHSWQLKVKSKPSSQFETVINYVVTHQGTVYWPTHVFLWSVFITFIIRINRPNFNIFKRVVIGI